MNVGVITGGHAFDVIGFHRLFRRFGDLDCYIQSLEEWAVDYHRSGGRYEVLAVGHDDQTWSDERFRQVLGRGIAWCGRKL